MEEELRGTQAAADKHLALVQEYAAYKLTHPQPVTGEKCPFCNRMTLQLVDR